MDSIKLTQRSGGVTKLILVYTLATNIAIASQRNGIASLRVMDQLLDAAEDGAKWIFSRQIVHQVDTVANRLIYGGRRLRDLHYCLMTVYRANQHQEVDG